MSKWLIWGHFRHLHFNNFPMTWRTPQGEVFWPLQSNSKILGVSKDSQVPISGMWMSSSHSSKSGIATKVVKGKVHEVFKKFWVKPFNWLIPHGPHFECENGKWRPFLYSFQNENGKKTLWDRFWTWSLFANYFVIRKFSCKLFTTRKVHSISFIFIFYFCRIYNSIGHWLTN